MFMAIPAWAQPGADNVDCKVSVVLAPGEVRDEIEAWVAAEPRCERQLEVRVVPTENGLYLSARDPSGRVRERIVPDAQSAAVLVVSWMADDSMGPTISNEQPPRVEVPRPPDITFTDDEDVPSILRATANDTHKRTVALGVIGGERNLGLRGQLDVLVSSRWVLGVGGGWAHDEVPGPGTTAGQARLLLALRHSVGPIAMRAQFGVGADFIDAGHQMETAETVDQHMHGADPITPALELSLFGSMQLTKSWGLIGGPVLHARGNADEPGLSLLLGVTRHL